MKPKILKRLQNFPKREGIYFITDKTLNVNFVVSAYKESIWWLTDFPDFKMHEPLGHSQYQYYWYGPIKLEKYESTTQ